MVTANETQRRTYEPLTCTIAVDLPIAVLRSNGVVVSDVYRLTFHDEVDPSIASKAYRLTKHSDNTSYDIHVGRHGAECDCQDWLNRPRRGGCKHIQALHAARYLGDNDLPKPLRQF